MGNDFMREQSGQPWRKRWDKGLDRLKLPGLFDVQFSSHQRTITADLDPGINVQTGEQLVVQCNSGNVTVCRGHTRVGAIIGLPSDMHSAISDCGGVALATVERISLFGNSAELSVR